MKILIAEDDRVTRRLLETLLGKWGYEVVGATNGSEAWKILQQSDPPRLVLLDWMMPEMDGVQVCHQVRQRAEKFYTYIVMLTAKRQKQDIMAGLDAGVDDYLTKPVDQRELRVRLRAGARILELHERLVCACERLHIARLTSPDSGLLNPARLADLLSRY